MEDFVIPVKNTKRRYPSMSFSAEKKLFAGLMILFSRAFVPVMPYLLSFAAGAMIYVVIEELIPEMSSGTHSNAGVLMFAFGLA